MVWQTLGVSGKPGPSGAPARASLKVLSGHLGLSPAAISRVLNSAPAARSIPQATQERIFAAARELNYRPNVLARSLRRGRSMTLGVLVPELSDGYEALVLSGLEQGLMQRGYFFFLISHHHRAELVERALTMLTERAVDGLVAVDTHLPHSVPMPAVTVSSRSGGEGVVNIVLNHTRAAHLAMEHLAGLGHRRIAYIKGQAFSSDTETRWAAILEAAHTLGIDIEPALVGQLEGEQPTHEPGYLAAQRLLASGVPFTALFTFNDISAIGAIRALREAGRRVPEDISVIGFDDVQSAAFQNPSLTTVRQPLHAMGMLAAETLVGQIEATAAGSAASRASAVGAAAVKTAVVGAEALPHPPSRMIVVDPELIVRESTCAAPGTSLREHRKA